VGGHELLDDRQHGLGLGLVALKGRHHEREAVGAGEQADGDLRFQPPLLRIAALAEPVALIGLEEQRADVIQTRLALPSPACAAQAAEIFRRQESFAYTASRRFSVAYDAAATPASSSTRSESSLLTGSMIRASTRSASTSSPPLAQPKPSTP